MSKKKVRVRNTEIGGGTPVTIQSMTNCSSSDKEALLRQIGELKDEGCDIVRIAIPDFDAAKTLKEVRKLTDMPLVADIHFDYRLALKAIEAGADKIRINPGNIGERERVEEVVKAAKTAEIPIRVGVNSGSLEKDILERDGRVTSKGLAESAMRSVKILEDMDFGDIVVSLKSSDVRMNYEAYKLISEMTEHPLHIGVTETGTLRRGEIKSAAGLGALLLSGIGDTMRVSLTENPVKDVILAREILEAVGLRKAAFDMVSCPTCGRTEIDLISLANRVEEEMSKLDLERSLKIAVMGCVVNGPGEAKEADYGVAGGKGKGVIFQGGEIIKTVEDNLIVDELMDLIKEREGKSGEPNL